MRNKELKRRMKQDYGKIPDPCYFPGDMEYIRAYSDFRRDHHRDAFLLDEITWNDLDMDDVFKRINPKLSTSGEQYLYYMLRSPAIDAAVYEGRKRLIDHMEAHDDIRLKLQVILARLGCSRRADLCRAFCPSAHGKGKLLVYLFLLLLIPLSALSSLFVGKSALLLLVLVLLCNSLLHEFVKKRVERDFDTVNYSVSMIFALRSIRKLHDAGIDAELKDAYGHLDNLRSVIRTGGISTVSDNGGIGDLITTFLLLDLITYEFLKNKLGRSYEDVFAVHENLGRIDAAIAVASYRKSIPAFCEPELCFQPEAPVSIYAEQMTHPLLEEAVANDLKTERSVLITGSNASGKSTFLKAAALCAVLSQSICTCTAQSYRANAFRIYSSMALSDDLLGGESYYIVETKSLKRILDHREEPHPVLCVIDEVLRGTNTVERIAASCEILKKMGDGGALCLAATHDIELCELLSRQFTLCHFEEFIEDEEMVFDYLLREGPATSRNAINLLKLMGFDDSIVEGAHRRANQYLQEGTWS